MHACRMCIECTWYNFCVKEKSITVYFVPDQYNFLFLFLHMFIIVNIVGDGVNDGAHKN